MWLFGWKGLSKIVLFTVKHDFLEDNVGLVRGENGRHQA